MERREQFQELPLLWAWGVELCIAIVGPSQVRSHLQARMPTAPSTILKWPGMSPCFGRQYCNARFLHHKIFAKLGVH
jgi:hypothetical protein